MIPIRPAGTGFVAHALSSIAFCDADGLEFVTSGTIGAGEKKGRFFRPRTPSNEMDYSAIFFAAKSLLAAATFARFGGADSSLRALRESALPGSGRSAPTKLCTLTGSEVRG